MTALLAEYSALWEAMDAHVCLEGRAGELGAQIGALKTQAQHATDEQRRLDATARNLVQLRQAEQGDVKCGPHLYSAAYAAHCPSGSLRSLWPENVTSCSSFWS